MLKNDIFEIEITGMTDDGSGVGRAEGIAVFVPYTIVGEIVRVIIIKVNKSFAIGKLLDIIKPSEHRTKSDCEYYYKCGGCQLRHMDYEAEIDFKYNKVKECISRIGGINIKVSPVVRADTRSRYRNKVQLPVSQKGIGFYRRNSHDVIDIDDCLLQNKYVADIVNAVKIWMDKFNIEPYNEKENIGILRHVYIRSGESGIMVALVSNTPDIPHTGDIVSMLRALSFPITSVICNINSKNTNVILGKENIVLWGDRYIKDSIGDVEFKISPNSFYQVNSLQTQRLYETVRRMANMTGKEIFWDIYCGIGTIGQYISKDAKKIIGIEIVPQAVEDARQNAEMNKIINSEYYCGPAEIIASKLIANAEKPDVVVLDPPRKGCEGHLLDTVANLKPKRIVYVSCKPSTLARDLKYLEIHGYKTSEIVPVDMFPGTSHVECCVLMNRTH